MTIHFHWRKHKSLVKPCRSENFRTTTPLSTNAFTSVPAFPSQISPVPALPAAFRSRHIFSICPGNFTRDARLVLLRCASHPFPRSPSLWAAARVGRVHLVFPIRSQVTGPSRYNPDDSNEIDKKIIQSDLPRDSKSLHQTQRTFYGIKSKPKGGMEDEYAESVTSMLGS